VVFLAAFILPHGIFELPAVIIGAAAAVRVGASLINRDRTLTLGEGGGRPSWTSANC
jgi:uncharacterized membrane protein SpoIIM required for sporulation